MTKPFTFITTPCCPGLFRFLSLVPRIFSHGFPPTPPTIGPWSLDDRLCRSSTLLPYPFISLFPSLEFFELLGCPLLFLPFAFRWVCLLFFCLGIGYFVNKVSFESKETFYIHMYNTKFACYLISMEITDIKSIDMFFSH